MTTACVHSNSSSRIQEANMLGMALSMLAYGAHAAFFSCVLRHFLRPLSSRINGRFFACTCYLFTIATLSIVLQLVCDIKIFFGSSDNLDVTELFTTYTPTNKLSLAVTMIYLVLHWSSDALLLWRCSMICHNAPSVWMPMGTILVGLVVTGSYFRHDLTGLIMTWTTTPSTPGLVYLGVALGYNLILPAIMVIRIYRVSRELRGFWKSTEPRNVYGFVISVMFEATAFYAAVAIITIVTIAIDTSMRAALLPLLGQMQAIPSLLLTARAVQLRDAPKDSVRKTVPTSLQFDVQDALEKASLHLEPASRPTSPTTPADVSEILESIVIIPRRQPATDISSFTYSHSSERRRSRDCGPLELRPPEPLFSWGPDTPTSCGSDSDAELGYPNGLPDPWGTPQPPPMARIRS
ncbi:uncharacterized protein C8Q71DRAFT_108510 [Rhodofomes roseus]|uniref:Uncharacterized protein n=1 Tax=Rhodofomes roseus TaxID=34475 RepID=A0ABQ8KCX0_9APHY|nr:uncharacterized protein C8Q71DRAFT_108510 [Rhodofomes roseus]KAH9835195.1 hypothetical protein C8Q71DRAFT_108510 [Rhodofomes roseus]